MADQKTLNTRISLKIDTWANWAKTDVAGQGGNLVLKKGEIAFVQVSNEMPPVSSTDTATELLTNPNTVLFKVGDGKTAFKDLKWGSALAADVHGWAKQDQGEFETYIKKFIGDAVKDGKVNLDGYAKTDDLSALEVALTALIEGNDADILDLQNSVKTIEENYITTTQATTIATNKIAEIIGTEKKSDTEPATGMFAEIDDLQAEVAEQGTAIDGINEALSELGDTYATDNEVEGIRATLQSAIDGKVDLGAYNTKVGELAGLIGGNTTEINTIKTNFATKNALEYAVTELKGTSGDTKDSASIAGVKLYADAAIEDAIDTFYSTYIENDSKALDTLKDVTAWLDANKDGAADIVADITGLQNNKLDANTFSEFVTNDFTPVKTAVGKLNVTVLEGIDSDDVTKWDTAATDFGAHEKNTDIHITSDERTKWNAVDNKLDKSDFDAHLSSAFETNKATVKEATHAASANSANEATHATTADNATNATNAVNAEKATKDGANNVITETYETIANVNAIKTDVDTIKGDYLKAADEFIIDCGSSTVNVF